MTEVSPAQLRQQFASLEAEATERLIANQVNPEAIVVEYFADCRYLGQEHTLKTPVTVDDLAGNDLSALKARFDAYHERAYAHMLPAHKAQIVNLRLTAHGITSKPEMRELPLQTRSPAEAVKGWRPVIFAGDDKPVDCPVYDRDLLGPGLCLNGPAIIEEWTSTTLALPGQQVEVDRYGNLILTVCS
jgi:N-methylhydantoinase A